MNNLLIQTEIHDIPSHHICSARRSICDCFISQNLILNGVHYDTFRCWFLCLQVFVVNCEQYVVLVHVLFWPGSLQRFNLTGKCLSGYQLWDLKLNLTMFHVQMYIFHIRKPFNMSKRILPSWLYPNVDLYPRGDLTHENSKVTDL